MLDVVNRHTAVWRNQRTPQDRLVKELRTAEVRDMKAGNAFLRSAKQSDKKGEQCTPVLVHPLAVKLQRGT
jgi:hypothetical protein